MGEERRLLARLVACALVTGVIAGLTYLAMTWSLADAIRAGAWFSGVPDSKAPLTFYLLVSVLHGWFMISLGEPSLDLCGWVMTIPVAVGTVVAIGVGLGLSAMLVCPLTTPIYFAFALSAFSTVLAAFVRIRIAG